MQVAAVGAFRGVKVAMCIQPKNKQWTALSLCMAHGPQHSARCQSMIAPHENRSTFLQCGLGGGGKALGPSNGFLKRM